METKVISPVTINNGGSDRTESVSIVTDIEGGNIHKVTRMSGNHFSLEMRPDTPSFYKYPDHNLYWFYFKVLGVKGKELKIDITNCEWMPRHWKRYRPVYSYAEDPDCLTGVEWHRIENTALKRCTFSFRNKFQKDHAWIALRYPYNYSRQRRYIESIRDNKNVDIEVLGKTFMGNPLHMIIITERDIPAGKKKGILVYAREHGVEQDGSWVAEGMVDCLLSSEYPATVLRRNLIFMIVPIISPDAAIAGQVVDPETGTSFGIELMKDRMGSVEAKLLYDRVKRFVHNGNTLDVSFSFHNPHGTEPNLYPYYRPYRDSSLLKKAREMHKAVLRCSHGYTKWKEFTNKSCTYSVGRFARDFGSISMIYEVNHQAKNNYLSVEKLKGLGEVILRGITDYYGLLH